MRVSGMASSKCRPAGATSVRAPADARGRGGDGAVAGARRASTCPCLVGLTRAASCPAAPRRRRCADPLRAGRCDSIIKAGRLRALYLQLQADLAGVPVGAERALATAIKGAPPPPPIPSEESPTLNGRILGRLAQLERQRAHAHIVGTTGFRAQLGIAAADRSREPS